MSQPQFATPFIVKDDKAAPLHRIEFDDSFRDEDWLQEMLFDHPELIPFYEIEPAFKDSVAVAREVESGSGPIDILYVNPDGLLTLVETKLWRNPESRRVVVSQLIDYAASLARMSYDELKDAISVANETTGDDLAKRASTSKAAFDRTQFHDAISRNLKRGRFLLLIAGDGIREDVDSMTEFLQGQPHLGFTLALVEMALFRLMAGKNDQILIQPRIVARTKEVVRAIVTVSGGNVIVETPPEPKDAAAGRFKITAEQFFGELAKEVTPETVNSARWIVDHAAEHDLIVQWMQGGPVFKYVDSDNDIFFTLGQFDQYGNLCSLRRFSDRIREHDLPADIWADYYNKIIELIPGASRKHGRYKNGNEWDDVYYDEKANPLDSLMEKKDEWLVAVDKAIKRIREALAKQK